MGAAKRISRRILRKMREIKNAVFYTAGERMMRIKKQLGQFAVLFLVLFWGFQSVTAAPTYIADGLMEWQRGADGSTWQEWTFDEEINIIPEASFNSYGTPKAAFSGCDGSVSFGWKDSILGRQGVWTGDPVFVELWIPNSPAANAVKTVWFEMEYRAVSMLSPTILVEDGFEVEQIYYNSGLRRDRYGMVIDDWRTMVVGWNIYPNPSQETISFALAGTGGFVDRIAVDTICVPEPGAMVLGGIGVSLVGFWKRKRAL